MEVQCSVPFQPPRCLRACGNATSASTRTRQRRLRSTSAATCAAGAGKLGQSIINEALCEARSVHESSGNADARQHSFLQESSSCFNVPFPKRLDDGVSSGASTPSSLVEMLKGSYFVPACPADAFDNSWLSKSDDGTPNSKRLNQARMNKCGFLTLRTTIVMYVCLNQFYWMSRIIHYLLSAFSFKLKPLLRRIVWPYVTVSLP